MIQNAILSAILLLNVDSADDLRVYETCVSVCVERFPGVAEVDELDLCNENCNDEENSRCLVKQRGNIDGIRKCWVDHLDRCKGLCDPDSDACIHSCKLLSKPEEDLKVYMTCLDICKERFPDGADGIEACLENCKWEQAARCKSQFPGDERGQGRCETIYVKNRSLK
ncbi:hypothetical protein CSKR_108606 [Clonorchis sinensis]|uniref:Uncharacterized protein n=1 Tax=Clonorchis sinensis TaxID=79923 RepID=A0A8T1M0D7_CLOSI|nr:hypothetical protein CSKR_108606 [Clonorchis sinensis]KAG5442419.1 hypothetical protein CSKR_108606 [Clonorchis sinensis]